MENCVALTQFSPWRNAPRRRPWKRQRWRIAGRSASECARPGSGAAPCMYHSQLRPSPCAGTARHRGVQEMAHPARQAQPDETRTAPGKASTPQLSRRRLSNGSIPDLSQARRTATNAPEPTDRPSSAGALFADVPDIEDVPNPRALPRAAAPQMLVVPLRPAGRLIQARRTGWFAVACNVGKYGKQSSS